MQSDTVMLRLRWTKESCDSMHIPKINTALNDSWRAWRQPLALLQAVKLAGRCEASWITPEPKRCLTWTRLAWKCSRTNEEPCSNDGCRSPPSTLGIDQIVVGVNSHVTQTIHAWYGRVYLHLDWVLANVDKSISHGVLFGSWTNPAVGSRWGQVAAGGDPDRLATSQRQRSGSGEHPTAQGGAGGHPLPSCRRVNPIW